MSEGCKHKWVLYQPLNGEEYTCCANAGCGISFIDWLNAEVKKKNFKPLDDDEYGWLYGVPNPFVESVPQLPSGNKVECPVKPPPKKGWVPVELSQYFTPPGYEVGSVITSEDIDWIVKSYDKYGNLPGVNNDPKS